MLRSCVAWAKPGSIATHIGAREMPLLGVVCLPGHNDRHVNCGLSHVIGLREAPVQSRCCACRTSVCRLRRIALSLEITGAMPSSRHACSGPPPLGCTLAWRGPSASSLSSTSYGPCALLQGNGGKSHTPCPSGIRLTSRTKRKACTSLSRAERSPRLAAPPVQSHFLYHALCSHRWSLTPDLSNRERSQAQRTAPRHVDPSSPAPGRW
mmetsp:Transcript_56921/g.144370  ORF Transcript_56921/g.144370 Transcript_56921/m.144370 type:complete len:209 (-) Transcript_56921:1342-1968(-)